MCRPGERLPCLFARGKSLRVGGVGGEGEGLKGKQVEGGDGRGAPCTAGRHGGGEGLVVGLDAGEGPMEGEWKV